MPMSFFAFHDLCPSDSFIKYGLLLIYGKLLRSGPNDLGVNYLLHNNTKELDTGYKQHYEVISLDVLSFTRWSVIHAILIMSKRLGRSLPVLTVYSLDIN